MDNSNNIPTLSSEDIDIKVFLAPAYQYDVEHSANERKLSSSKRKGKKKRNENFWVAKSTIDLREIRVNLTRLQFGSDGKPIVPINKHVSRGLRKVRISNRIINTEDAEGNIKVISKPPTNDTFDDEYVLPTTSSKSMNIHGVINSKRHECEECHKEFSFNYELTRHYARCLPFSTKSFKCKSCAKTFVTKTELKIHSRIHSGKKPFKCEVCKKVFRHKANMVEHKKLHQPNGKNLVCCTICNKGFAKKSKMLIHFQNVHLKANVVECSEPDCKKTFSDKNRMNAHVKTFHRNEFKHKCKECGRGFPDNHKFTIHMRIHTGEKPFKCKYCPKAFVSKSILDGHLKVHTNDYKYRCGICGRGTISPNHLIIHLKLHNKEKTSK